MTSTIYEESNNAKEHNADNTVHEKSFFFKNRSHNSVKKCNFFLSCDDDDRIVLAQDRLFLLWMMLTMLRAEIAEFT
jgi:hypothetical protein